MDINDDTTRELENKDIAETTNPSLTYKFLKPLQNRV
jgi:hypothetical protein